MAFPEFTMNAAFHYFKQRHRAQVIVATADIG